MVLQLFFLIYWWETFTLLSALSSCCECRVMWGCSTNMAFDTISFELNMFKVQELLHLLRVVFGMNASQGFLMLLSLKWNKSLLPCSNITGLPRRVEAVRPEREGFVQFEMKCLTIHHLWDQAVGSGSLFNSSQWCSVGIQFWAILGAGKRYRHYCN